LYALGSSSRPSRFEGAKRSLLPTSATDDPDEESHEKSYRECAHEGNR
jgi:hypothetical protein